MTGGVRPKGREWREWKVESGEWRVESGEKKEEEKSANFGMQSASEKSSPKAALH